MMGGKIWLESEVGRGSTFHFVVALEVQSNPQVEKPVAPALRLTGTRVLIVDDNPTNRLILREMVSRQGALVTEAEDGPSALAAVRSAAQDGNPYQLMLLDCRMPGMDGSQVAREVRAMFNDCLTVVMLSSDDLKMKLAHAQ
jgi:two-component system, sensor histidine kinase and response regulator